LLNAWTPNTGQWYHLAFTYDGSETSAGMEIYVDGVITTKIVSDLGTYVNMVTFSGSPLTIGANAQSDTRTLDGQMEGFAIWDKALSQSEVTNIYLTQNGEAELI